MNTITIAQESDTLASPSASIWGDCPVRDLKEGKVRENWGYYEHYDFARFRTASNVNAAEAYWEDGYKVFGSDGGSIALVDAVGGGVAIGSDGDNEGVSIAQNMQPFQLSRDHGKFWFEARVKTSTVADTKHGIFLGLVDSTALTATVPLTAAGALADLNLVGFLRAEGDGDNLDTVYKANGVTAVTVKADALTGAAINGGTLPSAITADSYLKLGIKYIPRKDRAGDFTLAFYVNGIRLPDTKQLPSAAGTDFPNDVRLGLCLAVLNATASTPGTTAIQWWRAAQLAV